jgi:hypothetical protein
MSVVPFLLRSVGGGLLLLVKSGWGSSLVDKVGVGRLLLMRMRSGWGSSGISHSGADSSTV